MYTLEFDVEVEGDENAVLLFTASLHRAAAEVSSSQLQAAAAAAEETAGHSSTEGGRLRAVSLDAFKPLHAVGRSLSPFIGAHLSRYRVCRQQQDKREAAEIESERQKAQRRAAAASPSAQQQQQQQQDIPLSQLQQQLHATGITACHLPLIILKPRFVVHKLINNKNKKKPFWGSASPPQVHILPVIKTNKTKKNNYSGRTARSLDTKSSNLQIFKQPNLEGFPVILFR